MIARLRAWLNALEVARLYVKNWPELLILAMFGKEGKFEAKGGGVTNCISARFLLKNLVRVNNVMNVKGLMRDERIKRVHFNGYHIVIKVLEGFGRIVLRADKPYATGGIFPEDLLLEYDVDVKGKVVLDIGAFVGDSPLFFLWRGAKHVIAVEPVPDFFELLIESTKDFPVTPINAAVGEKAIIPKYLETYIGHSSLRQVPVISVMELVMKYKPHVVKIDCEGCEHAILDEIVELPEMGVETIIVEFHDRISDNKKKMEAYNYVTERLGKGRISRISDSTLTVIWGH